MKEQREWPVEVSDGESGTDKIGGKTSKLPFYFCYPFI
jgi:hypothetical protein